MFNARPTEAAEFRDGDNVVLAEGSYQGTPGVFLRLRQDPNWAEIKERNGVVRHHPVAWLQHSDPPEERRVMIGARNASAGLSPAAPGPR